MKQEALKKEERKRIRQEKANKKLLDAKQKKEKKSECKEEIVQGQTYSCSDANRIHQGLKVKQQVCQTKKIAILRGVTVSGTLRDTSHFLINLISLHSLSRIKCKRNLLLLLQSTPC